ncbi:conserved hypothetical protein [Verticillium alfalfae VaMs.102]|uniref:Uncharacterized protein n=1 Tax=Verticillium alfalfae (strain VaMs.102 / ATCC MYA-4576 / FGSC 10136) TaxID=526221 RepID=C9SYS2_VERA1|nr:conserved hypothetical protein [Verticillium alfalfae VaMs.102]EEY23937.1 conserved hypothetical protein [Verticillium alfalfae VaMs.102]
MALHCTAPSFPCLCCIRTATVGKQLFGVFKEAKACYQEKKAAIKADKAFIKRAQTFDVARDIHAQAPPPPPSAHSRAYVYDDYVEYQEDARSRASHRSHRTSRTKRSQSQTSRRTRGDVEYHARPALTASNLKTHSEVSSVAPSRVPRTIDYRSPYAETAPRDMALSRPTLHHYTTAPTATESLADSTTIRGIPAPSIRAAPAPPEPGHLARAATFDVAPRRKEKEIDMNLAYGNIPPDLESRTDLDPAYKEAEAKTLIGRVESLLDEAECVGYSATTMIKRLQADPNAAAAVALSLAELSKLLKTMSPAFLGLLKGGSPAVFALLASPQFLIAAGAAVGMTVVMFGGWKIVKQIKDAQAQKEAMARRAMAFEALPEPAPQEELSTIESWRRGIAPFGEDDSADFELISPEAERALRKQRRAEEREDDDMVSRSGRSERSSRTHRSSRTTKTTKTTKTHRSHHSRKPESEAPDRRSTALTVKDDESVAGSQRSHRSTRSKRSERTAVLAIEPAPAAGSDNGLEHVLRPKKDSMLKSLFKKKEKDGRLESREKVSAVVF